MKMGRMRVRLRTPQEDSKSGKGVVLWPIHLLMLSKGSVSQYSFRSHSALRCPIVST